MDQFPYQELYDKLRRHGYHDAEDASSHLAPYIGWLKSRLQYGSVLDIGCSSGGSLPLLGSEGVATVGVDVSMEAVAKASNLGRDVRHASATALPFEDASFDLVVSADVFEHLHEDDAQAAAHEAVRVARRHIFMKIASQEDVTQRWKDLAGHPLHLTTKPIEWWMKFFSPFGKFIRHEQHVFCLEKTDVTAERE
ncbi:MAG: class I SAM-dependent methyltransferase [Planctomycetales bacterium]|nr:class I SAM-dependent methyltransferase [Planctomycetales bacterium]